MFDNTFVSCAILIKKNMVFFRLYEKRELKHVIYIFKEKFTEGGG